MSTDINSVAGKARNLGVNTWLVLLGIAVLVFGLNTGYATWKAARLGGASSAASDLQVLSQQLANQGREAVGGDAQSFDAFKQTKAAIDEDIETLNANFGNEPGVSGPIATVTETWTPLGASAEQMIASERAVLGLADNASSFAGQVPQLQANLDELVRAMSSSGSTSSQVYLALRQVVLSGTMARRITEIQAGGPAAATAGDALARDAAVFDNVMTGLREGDETLGVTALSNSGALAALGQAQALWTDMKGTSTRSCRPRRTCSAPRPPPTRSPPGPTSGWPTAAACSTRSPPSARCATPASSATCGSRSSPVRWP